MERTGENYIHKNFKTDKLGDSTKKEIKMKSYEKPNIKDIDVILQDIIAISNGGSTTNGDEFSLTELFPTL